MKRAVDSVRAGVIAARRRAAGLTSALPPISPRDVLMGTCLRFDAESKGFLGKEALSQVGRWGSCRVVSCLVFLLSVEILRGIAVYHLSGGGGGGGFFFIF